jgi:hypothetical protein
LARLFVVIVNGDLFQVVGFEHVIAIHASQIFDPVSPHQEFRALVLTTRHRTQIILILMMPPTLSSPPLLCRVRRYLKAAAFILLPALALAQGGPPFLSDDPDTPGNKHWEINLGFLGERSPL